MKKPLTIAAALLMLVAPAASQEPMEGQMMFCDDSGCAWVDDPALPAPGAYPAPEADYPTSIHPGYPPSQPYVPAQAQAHPAAGQHAPSTAQHYPPEPSHDATTQPYSYPSSSRSGWPVDPYTGKALQGPSMGAEPVVMYGYSPLSIPPAIALKPPQPLCPPSKGQALAQFAQGVELGDINQVISSYEWSGVSHAQAGHIINRLSSITPGSWQQRYVEASFDADFSAITHEQSFRWSRGHSDPGLAFDLVENSACWFVKFSA